MAWKRNACERNGVWMERKRRLKRWRKCFLHVFPYLWACSLHVFCVSPPQQHGQAPNQALLQPQHLCVGQTVSGAAQVADVPSHERGSRNARQEAQCAWQRQLCKLRRDVWQHLTPRHPPLAPLLPLLNLFLSFSFPFPPPPSSSSLHPTFFFIVFGLESACWFYLLDWHEKNLTATNFSVLFSFPFFWQTIRLSIHKCNSGAGSDIHLCVLCVESFDGISSPWYLRIERERLI